ncbi:MAG: hypothetical protein NVS1B9_10600 [Solirubrobacteraceae bacterium]
MARVLIVAGGCRGLELAGELRADGHAVRITTRTEAGRARIERAGAECWIGTPDRIASLRYALENVTVVCWLLGCASGERIAELHGSRLDFMLAQTIDTTVRGVIYEAAGSVAAETLATGAELVARRAGYNEIPFGLLDADPRQRDVWLAQAKAAVARLL